MFLWVRVRLESTTDHMEEDDYDPDDLITVVVVPPDCVRFYAVKRISAK